MEAETISVKIINSEDELNICLSIRKKVFVDEQNVPPEIEHDKFENSSIHFLASIGNKHIGTGRLRKLDNSIKFERVATLKEMRGMGIGKVIMNAMEEYACKHFPDLEMMLHAQTYVVSFYEKLGWRRVGKVFKEADIDHVKMTK